MIDKKISKQPTQPFTGIKVITLGLMGAVSKRKHALLFYKKKQYHTYNGKDDKSCGISLYEFK